MMWRASARVGGPTPASAAWIGLAGAVRHALVQQVRQIEQQAVELRLQRREGLFAPGQARTERFDFRQQRRHVHLGHRQRDRGIGGGDTVAHPHREGVALRRLEVEALARRLQDPAQRAKIKAEIGKAIVGHEEVVDGVLTGVFTGGNCLLEGVPGLGKTLLVRTLARVLDLEFRRIQFTSDLLPQDILGVHVLDANGQSIVEVKVQ